MPPPGSTVSVGSALSPYSNASAIPLSTNHATEQAVPFSVTVDPLGTTRGSSRLATARKNGSGSSPKSGTRSRQAQRRRSSSSSPAVAA